MCIVEFSQLLLKIGVIDLGLQGHLAIWLQNSKKRHSTSLLYNDLGRPREVTRPKYALVNHSTCPLAINFLKFSYSGPATWCFHIFRTRCYVSSFRLFSLCVLYMSLPVNKKKECNWYYNARHRRPMCGVRSRCKDFHDDVIKWKHFPRNWPFVRRIHRSPVNSRTKASDAELWCFLWSASE